MRLGDIINNLQKEDIINILEELGSNHRDLNSNTIAFQTICHNEPGEGKYKLIYYHETHTFHCFTECSCSYGLIELIAKVLGLTNGQAINWLYKTLNINVGFNIEEGFEIPKSDISFIKRFEKKETKNEILEERDASVLSRFHKLYHKSWIEENITKDAMRHFGILFDVYENRIIIPHYDIDGRLIGIKVRNLIQRLVDAGKKYMPLTYNGDLYNYPTSLNLYGIFENKEAIKKFKTVILFESEKSVLQHYSFYGDDSVAVAISGSAFSDYQIDLLNSLGVENVIIAVDKEFKEINDTQDWRYRLKVKKMFVEKLTTMFNVQIVWDLENELEEKMSPTDRGKEVWENLYSKRISVG